MNESYKNIRSILIDTNLLILYLTGRYNSNLIKENTRLKNIYTSEDFFILRKYLQKFKHLFITPHILAETSNLLFTGISKRDPFLLSGIKNILTGFEEKNINKNLILNSEFFEKFGATDCAIIQVARQKDTTILTDDSNLWGLLRKMQLPYENFFNIKGKHDFKQN